MTQNMVTVSADEMAKTINASGRIALYGILFDTNKAEIKPESRPALEEIAKFLHKEPATKLHVVGHTDIVGGYDSNLSLSKRRAEAVVAALSKEFGIAADRLPQTASPILPGGGQHYGRGARQEPAGGAGAAVML